MCLCNMYAWICFLCTYFIYIYYHIKISNLICLLWANNKYTCGFIFLFVIVYKGILGRLGHIGIGPNHLVKVHKYCHVWRCYQWHCLRFLFGISHWILFLKTMPLTTPPTIGKLFWTLTWWFGPLFRPYLLSAAIERLRGGQIVFSHFHR